MLKADGRVRSRQALGGVCIYVCSPSALVKIDLRRDRGPAKARTSLFCLDWACMIVIHLQLVPVGCHPCVIRQLPFGVSG